MAGCQRRLAPNNGHFMKNQKKRRERWPYVNAALSWAEEPGVVGVAVVGLRCVQPMHIGTLLQSVPSRRSLRRRVADVFSPLDDRSRLLNNDQNNLVRAGIALASPPNVSFVFARWQHAMFCLGFDTQISPSSGGQGLRSNTMCHWTPQAYLPNGT